MSHGDGPLQQRVPDGELGVEVLGSQSTSQSSRIAN